MWKSSDEDFQSFGRATPGLQPLYQVLVTLKPAHGIGRHENIERVWCVCVEMQHSATRALQS